MNSFDTLKSLVATLDQKDFTRKDWALKALKDDTLYFITVGVGLGLLIASMLVFNFLDLFFPIPRWLYMAAFITVPASFIWVFIVYSSWHEWHGRADIKYAQSLLRESPRMRQLVKAYREADYYDELEVLENEYYDLRSDIEYQRRIRD